MKHLTHTSRVFLGLLIISLLLTYIAITLSHYSERLAFDYGVVNHPGATQEPIASVDTEDWDTYQDRAYPIAFSYPPNWTVSTALTQDFYDIVLNIPNTANDIHIYIGEDGYYGVDGLQQQTYQYGSASGIIISNALAGMKSGEYYYTFDASFSQDYIPEFQALLKTVTFR